MTQRTMSIFLDEIYQKQPKKKYSTDKTDVYYIDNIWCEDILDFKEYCLEKIKVIIMFYL